MQSCDRLEQLKHPELQCPACKYLIHDPEASRCPECGLAIDAAELEVTQSLSLAWEREISHSRGRLTLALRTIITVWLRPWLPFRNRSLSDGFRDPVGFILFGLVVSFGLAQVGFLLWQLAEFARLCRFYSPRQAFELTTLGGLDWWLFLIRTFFSNLASAFIGIVFVLVVIRLRLRRRGIVMDIATQVALMTPSIGLTAMHQPVAGVAFIMCLILDVRYDFLSVVGFLVIGHLLFSIWRCAMIHTNQSKWTSAYLVVIGAIAMFVARMFTTTGLDVVGGA